MPWGTFCQHALAGVQRLVEEMLGVDELQLPKLFRCGEPFRFYALEVVFEVRVLGKEAEVLGA